MDYKASASFKDTYGVMKGTTEGITVLIFIGLPHDE